jgi:hypothetical protein
MQDDWLMIHESEAPGPNDYYQKGVLTKHVRIFEEVLQFTGIYSI